MTLPQEVTTSAPNASLYMMVECGSSTRTKSVMAAVFASSTDTVPSCGPAAGMWVTLAFACEGHDRRSESSTSRTVCAAGSQKCRFCALCSINVGN